MDGTTEGENKNTEGTQEQETNTPTVTEQAKNEKVFKQSEVNEIVKNRLASEKKSHADEKTVWENERTDAENKIQNYEKILGDYMKTQMAGLSELEKAALGKLSILDQIELLSKNTKNINFPKTPKEKEQQGKNSSKKINNFLG
jgi:hypothetical protein